MADIAVKRVLPKASVYVGDSDVAWIVAQTPSEVALLVHDNPDGLIELTLANPKDGWNSKPLYVRANLIGAISPPRNCEDCEHDG